jgi:hypothetical protein
LHEKLKEMHTPKTGAIIFFIVLIIRSKLKDTISNLEKDKEEITEIAEDYEKQLKDLEDDKNRRNRETMVEISMKFLIFRKIFKHC